MGIQGRFGDLRSVWGFKVGLGLRPSCILAVIDALSL